MTQVTSRLAGEKIVIVVKSILGQGSGNVSVLNMLSNYLGSITAKTVEEIREIVFDPTDPDATVQPAYYVEELEAIFKYDPNETGADNGTTILEDATTPTPNRWVKTNFFLDVYNANR